MIFSFWDRVSLWSLICRLVWPWTHRDLIASTSWLLGLRRGIPQPASFYPWIKQVLYITVGINHSHKVKRLQSIIKDLIKQRLSLTHIPGKMKFQLRIFSIRLACDGLVGAFLNDWFGRGHHWAGEAWVISKASEGKQGLFSQWPQIPAFKCLPWPFLIVNHKQINPFSKSCFFGHAVYHSTREVN